jgi:hypothetical protein
MGEHRANKLERPDEIEQWCRQAVEVVDLWVTCRPHHMVDLIDVSVPWLHLTR